MLQFYILFSPCGILTWCSNGHLDMWGSRFPSHLSWQYMYSTCKGLEFSSMLSLVWWIFARGFSPLGFSLHLLSPMCVVWLVAMQTTKLVATWNVLDPKYIEIFWDFILVLQNIVFQIQERCILPRRTSWLQQNIEASETNPMYHNGWQPHCVKTFQSLN
jgi:hypothetical protein